MRLYVILLTAILVSAPAHAEILSVSCYSQIASGFSRQTNGNVFPVPRTNKQEALARAMINAKNKKCADGALPICPVGTIDLGITGTDNCLSVAVDSGEIPWAYHNSQTCEDSQVSSSGAMGICEKVSCLLVKSCVVPGA